MFHVNGLVEQSNQEGEKQRLGINFTPEDLKRAQKKYPLVKPDGMSEAEMSGYSQTLNSGVVPAGDNAGNKKVDEIIAARDPSLKQCSQSRKAKRVENLRQKNLSKCSITKLR